MNEPPGKGPHPPVPLRKAQLNGEIMKNCRYGAFYALPQAGGTGKFV